jgi:hypothetical protein
MSTRKIIPPEVIIEVYRRTKGNLRATARELGIDKDTARHSLRLYGAYDKPLLAGSVKALKHNVMPLPEPGKVKRYLLSSAQNNTHVFAPFLKNLEAYRLWHEQNNGHCELQIARFSYNKNQFLNPKSQKFGTIKASDEDQCWYDEAIAPYVCDDPKIHGTRRWQLAPDLFWCSEMNILPTATDPLSDLKTYTGSASSIFPHAKVAMKGVPTVREIEGNTKHIYTTGTVTGRNYVQKKAGLKAEFHHTFAAILAEVNEFGDWWVRQLVADSKGNFEDCPGGKVIKVANGEVSSESGRIEALNWGDIHAEDVPEERIQRYWGEQANSVVNLLRPKYQIANDIHSFHARSHHEINKFSKNYEKFIQGIDRVDAEVDRTAALLNRMEREFSTTVVISSNHDRFGERWLDECSFKSDLQNVEYYLEAQLERVRAIKRGETDWMFLEWAAKRAGCPETVRFLKIDDSFVICAKSGHPIECGLHGDIGPNGSRGSTMNLSTVGSRISKGHDHTATIKDGVYSAGTCALDQKYNRGGATTWSVSHIICYTSGKRAILTERSQRLWA